MANKRTPFGDTPDMLDSMDFDFDLGGSRKNAKEEKKRKPITKIITNVGKGSLSQFTSESFIRGAVARSMPRGYDTAIESGFEIRDSASQLYNSAADEYRKLKPQLQRTVSRMMPAASKILPSALSKRLKAFSQGPSTPQGQDNPDEDLLRSVLGELETTRETERLREYTERQSRDELREQVDQRRFNSNIKALASVDKRLAHMQAFNDNVVSRYQKRMLEVAYRQYFTQRDTLKLLAQEMPAQSELLKAIMHNSALPDMDKLTNRDRLHASLRSKLTGLAPAATAGLMAMMKKNFMDRVQGGIRGGASRAGNALSGMEMMSDANSMGKSMGMDTGGEMWKLIGSMATGAVGERLMSGFFKGMSPTGFTGQLGSKAGNLAKSWPELLAQWSKSGTKQTGLKGSVLSMLKGLVPVASTRQKVGGNFMMTAGDAGMFTKKTQKSIETIIPGFLSKIHHELAMLRTGKHDIDQTVWNDDKETFTTKKQRSADIEKRLFGDKSMSNLRDKAFNAADFASGGTELSHGARHALSHSMVAHSVTNQPLSIKSILKNVDPKHRREVGRAIRGNFTKANGARDDTRVSLLSDMMRELKASTPNAAGMMEGFQQLGNIDDLRELGLIHEEGDDRFLDHEAWTKRAIGGQQPGRGPNQYKRHDYAHLGMAEKKKDTISALGDTFVDLYKASDLNTPVVNAIALQMRNYTNAKTKRKAIDLEDVLDGLTSNDGRVVVSAADARKLVTRDGRVLPDYVKELKSKPATSGGGRFSRLANKAGSIGTRVDLATGRAGAAVDNWAESHGFNGRGGRAAAASSVKSTVQQAAQTAKATVIAQGTTLSTHKWAKSVKDKWTHAVGVSKGALDLYSSKGKKLLDAQLLKAGKYLSAKTGKPIHDMRDILDGVRDEQGHWVVDPTTAATALQTKTGEKFADLMDGLQTHLESAKETATTSPTVQGVLGVAQKATSAVHAQATQAASAMHEQLEQAAAPGAMGPMMELLEAFRDGNLQRLEGIGEVLTQILQNGGMGGGGGAATPGKRFNFHELLGKTVSAPFKAAGWLGRKGAKLYGRYVGGVFSGMHRLASGVIHTAGSLFRSKALGKVAADVYVKGDRPWRPRLTKGAMEAGFYFNINPDGKLGKPIKVPKDIGGPVAEVVNGKQDTLISLDDYKKGLTDQQGKSVVGKVLSGAWSATKAIGGFYGTLFTLPIRALMGVGGFVKNVVNYARFPTDVYVKGDNPWEPRLYARGMRAGHYVLEHSPRKRVRTVNDITGPVMDISKASPEVILKNEDLAKICDRSGKPFKLKASILVRLAGGALGLAGNVASGMVHLAGAVGKAGYHALALPFHALARVLGMGGRRFKAPKGGLPTHDDKVYGVLSNIQGLLKSRLPATSHHRAGEAADILKRDAMDEAAEDAAYKEHLAAGGKPLPGGKAAGRSGLGGIFGELKDGIKDIKKLKDGLKSLKNIKNIFGFLKKGKSLLGAGEVAGEALGAGEAVAGAGAVAGEVAAGAGAVEGIAGAAAAGGGLAAAGGTLAAVGGGILSVLASPVVLVAAAVAGVGYLAYRGFSDHKLRALKLRALRMAQYGVDVDQDLGNSKKIDQLESIFEPITHTNGSTATINLKELKKPQLQQIIKVLGLYTSKANSSLFNPLNWFHRHATTEDAQNSKNAQSWLDQRFKSVFCTWVGAAHSNGNVKLQDLDDKLTKKEQRDGLLKQVMTVDKKVYDQMASPFLGDPLTAGAKEVQARYQVAMANEKGTLAKVGGAIASTIKAAGSLLKKAGAGIMGAFKSPLARKVMSGLAAAGAAVASGLGLNVAAGAIESLMNKTGDGKPKPKLGLKKTGNLPKFSFLGGTMQALTAVRYKTYGLTDMDTTQVKAMFLLEQDVFQKIQYKGGVTASFNDDASYYFNQYAGYFGVSPSDDAAKVRWYAWFSKRFIPTLLQFCTAVKQVSKTTDPRDAETYLGPAHLLDVATSTVAATNGSGLFASSVWSYTDTPFDDNQPLNKDSYSTKDNIQILKDKVKNQTIAQQTASKGDPNAKPKGVIASAWDSTKKAASSAVDSVKAALGMKTSAAAAPPPPVGPEQGSSAAASIAAAGPMSPVGQAVKQPGNGSAGDVNKVPMPTGSGSYAAVEGTLDAAAKMTGVDPKLLGTFTGIESGWHPSIKAKTSSASGLGQFINSTWKSMLTKYGAKYGISPDTPQTDPRASALMLGEFIKENQTYLQKHLGRSPTDTELYMAHFLGPAGAIDLLKAGGTAIAASVNPKAAGSNQSIFYSRDGQALSVADVTKILDKKVSTYRDKVGGGGGATPATALASTPVLPNGAKTTTTANGPTGGVGGAQKAAGAAAAPATAVAAATPAKSTNGMAGIQPPSGGKAPPSGASFAAVSGSSSTASDPVAAYQSQQQQSAVAMDRQSQATQATSAAQGSQAISIQQQQTTLLQQVVGLLGKIEGHTGQIGSLASTGGASATTPTGAVKSADAAPTTPGGAFGTPSSASLPPPVVPVSRPMYS